MAKNLQLCLKTNWGHERFRPYQLEVIEASLMGRDTFVLMATGSGKSLCYQLPAVLERRGHTGPVTVVVSPLISLMEDQVLSLKNNGISACLVGGASDMKTEDKAIAGEFPLVFITPEKVSNWGHGLRAIETGPGLALFAVDESHCVAEWGHDFRPSYLELRSLRQQYPKIPIMALTATATPRVQSEIMSGLGLRNPLVAKTSFNRWNLHYSVKPTTAQARQQELSILLKGLDGSAIIYVMTKKEAEQTTADVARIVGSKGAKTYHGGMPHGERRAVHHAFIRDEVQVVVATLAFGMGIDKPDVRLVVHCGMPKTVEAYYQQTGRAGRDGLHAKCVLLFSRADATRQRNIMSMSTSGIAPSASTIRRSNELIAKMENFATGPGCRRRALLMYFGEDMGNAKCDGCDACDRAAAAGAVASTASVANSEKDVELFTGPARLVLQAVHDSGGRYGFSVPISLLMGTKNAQNRLSNATSKPSFGKGKERGKNEPFWKALFHQLVEREGFLLSVSFSSDSGGRGGVTYRLTDKGGVFLRNKTAKLPASFTPSVELAVEGRRLMSISSTPAEQQQAHGAHVASNMGLTEDELKIHGLLFKLRTEIATSQGIPPYNVLGGPVLRQLAQRRPIDLGALATVDGMSDKKMTDYGNDIIKVVTEACKQFKLEGNVSAKAQPGQDTAWLTTTRTDKPLTSTQLNVYEEYTIKGFLTIEQLAAGMIRPVSVGVFMGHLAACLEGGNPFEWDRRRLGIDQALENKVLGVLDYFEREGHKPLAAGFRLKPIFEELPPDTDKSAYNTIKLILARMRFESGGGQLPGSGGEILAFRPNAPSTGKKRSLPSWGSTSSKSRKNETRPMSSTRPAPVSLFTPSYEAPPSSGTSKARPAPVDMTTSSEAWTAEVVLRVIKAAGPVGSTFEGMLAANPGDEQSLRELLSSLQEDFVIFTKPAEKSRGQPTYLAL